MGDPYRGRLAGHAYRWMEKRNGAWIAECECGAISDSMLKGTTREGAEWHRQHKADMIDTFVADGVDDRGNEVYL